MGKASKWMINFLLGKKEEKHKKKDISLFKEDVTSTPTAIIPATPTYKRRWSFGRSTNKERKHKSSKSLDSFTTNPLVAHAIVELEKQQNNNMAIVAVGNTAATKTFVATTHVADGISKATEDAAATKIQAVFRSYLARKALCALRGLVKLQALVRGHQVRKQTNATLRRMHALMAIQVRARFNRIQMAEQESQLVTKSQSSRHRNFPHDNGFKRVHREAIDINLYETRGVLKSKHGYLNHSQIERTEHGITTYYSGDLSILKQQHQYEEFSFITAQNSPTMSKPTPGRASFSFEQPDYVNSMSHDYPLQPNYMANTESSRAKVRSQSEPKQRPKSSMKPKTKRNASMDGRDVSLEAQTQTQHSSSQSKRIAHENQDPWFIKLYRSTRSVKDSECDANSTTTSHSNQFNSLIAYEPHVTMF